MEINRFNPMKVLVHLNKLEDIARGNIPYPVEWIVYPSNVCNYNCGHCIMKIEKQEFPGCLPESTMEKIPDDAEKYGIKTVIFSGGGEPLNHTLTLEILSRLKEKGINTGLNTNGFYLNDATNIDHLRVSIDAASRKTYKKVHGFDGWDRVNDNLHNLRRGKELGLAFLIRPDNWSQIYQFCEWTQQFNPDFVHIRPAYLGAAYLEGRDDEMVSIMPSLLRIKETVEKNFKNVFFRMDKFDGYWTAKKYNKCRATPLIAVLIADGSFIVCQDVFKRFGNYNFQKFEECWNSKEHKAAIENININKCPRCVENGYNEIIQNVVMEDGLKTCLL